MDAFQKILLQSFFVNFLGGAILGGLCGYFIGYKNCIAEIKNWMSTEDEKAQAEGAR